MVDGYFKCKQEVIKGENYAEIVRKARRIYHTHSRQTRRDPFVRSPYFNKEKVFLNTFWNHINTKRQKDRKRRLVFYSCAIELIEGSRIQPEAPFKSKTEQLFRFQGLSADSQQFIVQIREELKTGKKYFTSVFPLE